MNQDTDFAYSAGYKHGLKGYEKINLSNQSLQIQQLYDAGYIDGKNESTINDRYALDCEKEIRS